MKGTLKLSFAIALALGQADAFALGLGSIEVKSGLNQPLNAEIPVLSTEPDEADGLIVSLASIDDFNRVGLDRSRIAFPIDFAVGKNAKGQTVIKLTSEQVVREPFLDFLVEVNWGKGRLLREYTVLLDPPVMAPATKRAPAAVKPIAPVEPAKTEPLPGAATAPTGAPSTPAATTTEPAPTAPSAEPAAPTPRADQYGPIATGETLWEIAKETRPSEAISMNQMMVALLRSNPSAFFADNVNQMKRGAILRIPSEDEIRSMSAEEASALVRAQTDEWQSTRALPTEPSRPVTTPAATTPTTAATTPTTKPPAGSRLELVPPKAGDGQAKVDRPGTTTGTGTAQTATLTAELARTKEDLASSEREVTELRSRVKELEDIKGKNDRFITLKDTELAVLQKKLKEAESSTASLKTALAAAEARAKSGTTTAATTPATTTPTTTATTPATTAPTTTSPTAKPTITSEDVWGNVNGEPPATTKPGDDGSDGTEPTTGTPTSPIEPLAGTKPGDEPGSAPVDAAPTTTTSPAATTTAPMPETTPAVAQPIEASEEQPWYMKTWVLATAGGGVLLAALLAFFGMRRSKESTERASMAGAYSSGAASGLDLAQEDVEEEAEAEAVASDRYAEAEPADSYSDRRFAETPVAAPTYRTQQVDLGDFAREEAPPAPAAEDDFSFDFDLADSEASPASGQATQASSLEDISVEVPEINFDAEIKKAEVAPMAVPSRPVAAPAPAPVAAPPAEDVFSGEDAVGTKLDLAKAYMDMGDPDGARSMLDEVMKEGSASQKDEARRLLSELK